MMKLDNCEILFKHGLGGVEKIHTFYFVLLKASLTCSNTQFYLQRVGL